MRIGEVQAVVCADASHELGLATVTWVPDFFGLYAQILQRKLGVPTDREDAGRGKHLDEPDHDMPARQSFAPGVAAVGHRVAGGMRMKREDVPKKDRLLDRN